MVLEGITRHPDLWFEDGNVILIAEDTGFCVYRGVLVGHSNVFRNELSQIPQSSGFDACPIVHMDDDSAKEVAIVLGILYNSGHSFYRNTIQASFETAAAALRLGSKYGFEDMKHEALRRISTCYTTDLANLHTHADDCDDPSKCPISWEAGDCIGVLHLARQLGLGVLVPAALYRCANDVPVEQIFRASAGQLPMLSLRELENCVRSREDLIFKSIQLDSIVSNMQPSPDCLRVRQERQTDLSPSGSSIIPYNSPLLVRHATQQTVVLAFGDGSLPLPGVAQKKSSSKTDADCTQIMKTTLFSTHDHAERVFRDPFYLLHMARYITGHTDPKLSPNSLLCASCEEQLRSIYGHRCEEIWTGFCGKYLDSRQPSETSSIHDPGLTAVSPISLRLSFSTSQPSHADPSESSPTPPESYLTYLIRFVRGLTLLQVLFGLSVFLFLGRAYVV